jgi:hypothetical protein
MKRYLALLLALYIIPPVFSAHAFLITLDQNGIQEAIRYGQDNKDTIEEVLGKIYSFGGSLRFEDGGMIRSKWYKIARMAAISEKRGMDLSPLDQTYILEDDHLQIDFVVYGYTLDFARGYTSVILQNNDEIKPDKIHAGHAQYCSPKKKSTTGFPCCRATLRTYFNYKSLDATKKAILVLRKNGKESHFNIDFSTFK